MKRLTSALRSNRLFVLILAGYVALAFGFSVANPIYESTDELHHFRYVRYLQEFRALPEQRFDQPRIQAHHPPLYYVIAALATGFIPPDRPALYEPVQNPYYGYRYWEINNDNKNRYLHGPDEQWPYSGVVLMVHVARWVNLVIGALIVWVTYRIGLTIFPPKDKGNKETSRPGVAAGAAAIVAFNPQFLFMSGAINNDVIAGLFGSILLWQGVTIIRFGLTPRRSIFLALAFALALMAKLNLAFALPLIELALLIAVWPGRDWKSLLKANGFIVMFVVLIAGWWFARNVQLYGELTGVQRMNELWGGRDPKESFWLAVSEIPYAWSSLWGRFGYGQIPLPEAVYAGALIVSLIGVVGLVLAFVRRPFDRVQIKQLALVIFSALLFAAALFGYMMSSTAGPMGRFYFPGLSAFALLLATGLTGVLEVAGGQRHYSSLMTRYAVPLVAFALALVAFFGYFVPAYAAPPRIDPASIAQPLDVNFDDQIELLGAQIDRAAAQPGDLIKVTLYWRARQPIERTYVEFVHLVDDQGIIVAQRDTWPGRGLYPTTLWRPGEVIEDSLYLNVPDGAYAPDVAEVKVGWYEQDGTRLKASDLRQGQAVQDDALPIGEVAIAPRAGAYPNAAQINFGNQVELLGYEMSPPSRSILPGESITVTLYWRSRAPFADDYSVFLNALRPNLRTSAQDTSQPLRNSFSTRNWTPGQVITDVRVLSFPPTARSGLLDVEVGWFLPKVGRLPVLADDGHEVDSRQLLSKIRIRDE